MKYKMVLGEMWLARARQNLSLPFLYFEISFSLTAVLCCWKTKGLSVRAGKLLLFFIPRKKKHNLYILFTLKDVFLQKRNPKTKSATCLACLQYFKVVFLNQFVSSKSCTVRNVFSAVDGSCPW